jgi:type VI protein secretion system component VasK
MRRSDDDLVQQAMSELVSELSIPPELEERLLASALEDPGPAARDDASDVMRTLEAELSIPMAIEARMLEAATSAVEPSAEVAKRPGPRLVYALPLAAAALGLLWAGSGWLGAPSSERSRPDVVTTAPVLPKETEHALALVEAIDWHDGGSWSEKMATLENLRQKVDALDSGRAARVAPKYVDAAERAFLHLGRNALEKALRASNGEWSLEDRAHLKQYLLLNDPAHLATEADWQAKHFSATCAEAIAARSRARRVDDVQALVEPHVVTFVRLVERGLAAGPDLDEEVISGARALLRRSEPRRFYDVFVTPFMLAPRDPSLPASRENLAYPPITLESIIADGAVFQSRTKKQWGTPYEVLGAYTGKARRSIERALDEASATLRRDAWVVADAAADARTLAAIERVRADYDGLYIQEWVGFFRDIDVARPSSHRDAPRYLRALAGPESPLLELLRVLRDNTHAPAPDAVAERFGSAIGFARHDSAPVAHYLGLLTSLADDLDAARGAGRPADEVAAMFEARAYEVRALLRGLDENARELLGPLLLAPLEPPARR